MKRQYVKTDKTKLRKKEAGYLSIEVDLTYRGFVFLRQQPLVDVLDEHFSEKKLKWSSETWTSIYTFMQVCDNKNGKQQVWQTWLLFVDCNGQTKRTMIRMLRIIRTVVIKTDEGRVGDDDRAMMKMMTMTRTTDKDNDYLEASPPPGGRPTSSSSDSRCRQICLQIWK